VVIKNDEGKGCLSTFLHGLITTAGVVTFYVKMSQHKLKDFAIFFNIIDQKNIDFG